LFEIVAHRGCPEAAPENTLTAFQRALDLGADAVELDVRLTADGVPVVYHYFYLHQLTTLSGAIFNRTWAELRQAQFRNAAGEIDSAAAIPTLDEVLDALGGSIGLEVELKGPEPEAVAAVAWVLSNHLQALERLEVTSSEPMLLERMRQFLPDVPGDLLIPRSEAWMDSDIVAYMALQRGCLAGARAVHLHPSQLSQESVDFIRRGGLEVHTWDVNDLQALELTDALMIPRLDTDNLQLALSYREGKKYGIHN
jgi:glycerophosphoryl diester phosphodiesterase